MSLVKLTQGQTEKIQIDEGIVVVDLGKSTEKILGPCRGGVEFTSTPSIRDIEYDGRLGKTKGLQVKDGEDISLKIVTLNCSQEVLAMAIPNVALNDSTKKIEQGDFGVIKSSNYVDSVSVITQTLDGKYKVLSVKNLMHEGAFTFKAAQKSENEHNLELLAHYDPSNPDDKLWSIEDAETNPIATGD